MNVSLNWLRKYVELPDSTEHLRKLLTESGLEVEAVEDPSKKFSGVVIGEVLTCIRHPNADKLSVCTVSDGETTFPVVCGAPNVAAGQKVPFARPGAFLAAVGITIEKRKIRGEASEGMICAPDELGLPGGHEGIIVYPGDAPLGMRLQEYLEMDDVIFQIGITPNRGDALSYIGVARDIAALTGKKLTYPDIADRHPGAPGIAIEIQTPDLCPRYSGAVVNGITVGPSPAWMQRALEAAGVRPINCVVDATNYVMMEFGQPMHAFDLDTLEGGKIIVRASEEGEAFTTLDGKQRTLDAGAVMICDAKKPVALGGVMGGANSEISAGTVNILLESAYFHPSTIRKTAKKTGVGSESSYRFERHVDPSGTMRAMLRAVDLILESSGGTYAGYVDAYPKPFAMPSVELRYSRIGKILGIDVPKAETLRILKALEFEIEDKGDYALCTSPACRTEMDREIDLIEEVARIYGYDKIPTPERITMHSGARQDDDAFTDNIRALSIGIGFDELVSPSLISLEHAEVFSPGNVVSVMNPVNTERPALRTSVLPSILEAIGLNVKNGVENLSVFEMGAVFRKSDGSTDTLVPGFEELFSAGYAITGNAQNREWYGNAREYDVFDLKGMVEALLKKLHIRNYGFLSSHKSITLSGNGLQVRINGEVAGELVEISKEILKAFDIDRPVFAAELKLSALEAAAEPIARFVPVPKYPVVYRDLAFLVANSVTAAEMEATIRTAQTAYLMNAHVVDVYKSESLGNDKKSIALTVTFQAPDRTLTEKEIEKDLQAITKIVESTLNAELRST